MIARGMRFIDRPAMLAVSRFPESHTPHTNTGYTQIGFPNSVYCISSPSLRIGWGQQLFFTLRGIPAGDGIRGDRPCDHASRADYGIVADGDARQDDGPAPDPNMAPDRYIRSPRADRQASARVGIHTFVCRNRVNGGVNFHIGAEQGIVADGNSARVQKGCSSY